jgi:type 1 glutamine amidotransferase
MLAGVICGDKYHPADIVREGMDALDTGSIALDYILDASEWSRERMNGYGVIVLSKGNARSPVDLNAWLTDEVQQDLVEFVERGGGLLVVHSGTVGYKNEPLFRHLVGGAFAHHPAPGPVEVQYTGASEIPGLDPTSFTVHDEHYLMEMFHDDLSVFLTSSSPHGTQPAGWTRRQGRGRICAVTPGHYREVWLHPEYQRILERALAWCAGEQ